MMLLSCGVSLSWWHTVRPNLDGPNFGFAHRIGQAAKADAIRKGYAQKAAVSQPTSGNSMPLGVTQQVKVRQHVHGEIAAKRSVAVAAIATNSGDLDRALNRTGRCWSDERRLWN